MRIIISVIIGVAAILAMIGFAESAQMHTSATRNNAEVAVDANGNLHVPPAYPFCSKTGIGS
jgi:hypothetical protein